MKNKRKNNILYIIETSIYSVLFITFIVLNFYNIDTKIANIIYIIFIILSFGWLFSYEFLFTKIDNAVHYKMFRKYYVPTGYVNKKENYKRNLSGVIILWILYLTAIGIIKYMGILTWQLFLAGACIMFMLNSLFTRKICLLSIFFLHNKNNCCKNCGINCWDYLIFASALIFAPKLSVVATIINDIIIILSTIMLIIWEYNYYKYPYRFYPETNKTLSCRYCLKQCKYNNNH